MSYQFPTTYSGISIDEAKSALQKSIRRGIIWDTIQWIVELYYSKPVDQLLAIRTNLYNRLLVIAVEDVSPSETDAIRQVYLLHEKYKDTDLLCQAYITAGIYLCELKKSRVNDWAVHYYHDNNQDLQKYLETDLNLLAYYLELSFQSENALQSLFFWKCLIISKQTIKYKNNQLLNINYNNPYQNKYKKPLYLFWLVINKLYPNNEYLNILYNIAISNNWRWSHKSHLIYCHIIHLIIYKQLPLTNKTVMSIYPDTKLFMDAVLQRIKFTGVPDYAIDKHTIRGRELGRGHKFFIKYGALLNNTDQNWQALSDFYYKAYNP